MDAMEFRSGATVVDPDGRFLGTLVDVDAGQAGTGIVVRTGAGEEVHIAGDAVMLSESTADRMVVELDENHRAMVDADASTTLSRAEETVELRKREVEKGRVIVRKHVATEPFEETVELARDEVHVERVQIDEIVDSVPEVRIDNQTTVIPVVEEVVVVQKRIRVIEEVRVTTVRTSEQHVIREDLRRESVDIEEESNS